MEQETQQPRIAVSKLIVGLCLIVIGTATFLGAIDVWHVRHFWKFWPLLLIAIGLANEIEALQRRKSDGGYVLLAVGCWMFVGTFHFFGLSVREAFPIGVVVAGLAVALHALIDRPLPQGKEKDHVC